MCEASTKRAVTERIYQQIAPEIARQEKHVVIPEVVRMLLDDHHKLGIVVLPQPKDDNDLYQRKHDICNELDRLYAEYTSSFASIGDIMTDLVDMIEKRNLCIVMLR